MRSQVNQKNLLRMIDANYNRAKEGLRVCEDIFRFIENDTKATGQLKDIRHALTEAVEALGIKLIIAARDVRGDVGQRTTASESKRKDLSDVVYANSQRVKESIRVLEETAKLINAGTALKLKKLRYQFYVVEQKMVKRR